MIVGIDLLWVKPKKSGGIESYVRNLLDGFDESSNGLKFILFVSKDNYETFEKYFNSDKFERCICEVKSENVFKRLLWENLFLDKTGTKYNVDVMFIPIYSKPIKKSKTFPYISVIHDLQALHYPQYFSKVKYMWLKYAWKRCAVTSDRIIAISNFVKNDIIEKLKVDESKIKVIYNPVIKTDKIINFQVLAKKYSIERQSYFYSVSSMLPHKNLNTILMVIKEIKEKKLDLPQKLVISGVGGKSENTVKNLINELDIEDNVIITGFVSDAERDCLYKNASIFLFPSIFEGFGMPPIEAMLNGTTVITTSTTSIPEVTGNQAFYVNNPYDISEWIIKIEDAIKSNANFSYCNKFDLKNITERYIEEFGDLCKKFHES